MEEDLKNTNPESDVEITDDEGIEEAPVEEADEEENGEGNPDPDSEGDDPEEDPDEEEYDEEPKGRRSKATLIINRQKDTIQDLRDKLKKYENGETGDDDLELEDPELQKAIDKQLAPLRSTLMQQTDEEELRTAFEKYPDAKKHEKVIRKYMDSPAYKDASIEFIVRGVLGGVNDAKRKQADDKVNKKKTVGRSKKRPTKIAEKTAWDMSEKEFTKNLSKLRSGGSIN